MVIIEVRGLSKTYTAWRKPPKHAVRDLNLDVERGGVFGFLGPNGSGKTTTIRLLLGLTRANGGTIRLFGRPIPRDLDAVISRIGCLVETPIFFPNFSGRTNLSLLASACNVPKIRIQQLLELVGLHDSAEDSVAGYSLGMKQRLGIAVALLKSPELLILDEPTNGLDAAGIREIRQLVRELGANGVTVLLSSHHMSEIEQVCDKVAIMSHGRVVAEGSLGTLLAASRRRDARVQVSDPAAGRQVLETAGFCVSPIDGAWRVSGVDDPARLKNTLVAAGLYVTELSFFRATLEDVFLDLTESGAGNAGGPTNKFRDVIIGPDHE